MHQSILRPFKVNIMKIKPLIRIAALSTLLHSVSVASTLELKLSDFPSEFGRDFTLDILFKYAPDETKVGIGAYSGLLSYDPLQWNFQNVLFGDSLSPNGIPGIQNFELLEFGKIAFNEISFDTADDLIKNQEPSLLLFSAKFQPKKAGTSHFKISEYIISDANGNDIPVGNLYSQASASIIPEPNIIELSIYGLLVLISYKILKNNA